MEKKPKNYSLDEINDTLYNDVFKDLWPVEKKLAKQIFLEHTNESPNMFNIPSIWVPIVKQLMLDLITVDPNIYFFQVKEKFGRLKVYVKSVKHRNFVRGVIHGAARAVDVVTLAHLKTMNRLKK